MGRGLTCQQQSQSDALLTVTKKQGKDKLALFSVW